MTTSSNPAFQGWESVAQGFISYRSQSTIGATTIASWAKHFPPGSSILDLGCGMGLPISKALIDAGLTVHGVEASPTLAAEFHRLFPKCPIECAPVQQSTFLTQRFDGIVGWGLLFLLPEDDQRALVGRVARSLVPGGHFLFTAPAQAFTWPDASTGLESISLGAEAYRSQLALSGFKSVIEYDDEGDNHYYEAVLQASPYPSV